MKLEILIKLSEIGLKHAPLSYLGDLSMEEIDDSRFAIDEFKEHEHIDLDYRLLDPETNKTKDVAVGIGDVITLHPEEFDTVVGLEPVMLGYHNGFVSVAIWDDTQEDPIHDIILTHTMEEES